MISSATIPCTSRRRSPSSGIAAASSVGLIGSNWSGGMSQPSRYLPTAVSMLRCVSLRVPPERTADAKPRMATCATSFGSS